MKNIKTKKSIIWDWNGTLLNDAELALFSINVMLKKRLLPTLSLPEYKQVFNFPVKDYYLRIGFDFEKESCTNMNVFNPAGYGVITFGDIDQTPPAPDGLTLNNQAPSLDIVLS